MRALETMARLIENGWELRFCYQAPQRRYRLEARRGWAGYEAFLDVRVLHESGNVEIAFDGWLQSELTKMERHFNDRPRDPLKFPLKYPRISLKNLMQPERYAAAAAKQIKAGQPVYTKDGKVVEQPPIYDPSTRSLKYAEPASMHPQAACTEVKRVEATEPAKPAEPPSDESSTDWFQRVMGLEG